MTRRDFLKLSALWSLRAALAGAGGLGYVGAVEPNWVDVERLALHLPRLAPEFHGYRVAQLSDIHLLDWTTPARFAEIVGLVNREKPDLVAITGDFITRNPEAAARDLVSNLRNLRARNGVVAVLGNHDHWHGAAVIRDVLNRSGAIDLSNRAITLRRGGAEFHVAGVDDVWQGQDRLDLVLDALPRQGAVMLLAHEPDFADTSAATGRFDLQISGHSHGGQVVLPFAGRPRLPQLGQKYPSGRYRVGDMVQYTNRGIGMVKPHVRFNCRPEITVFTLESGG